MDLTVYHPTLIATTDPFNGRGPESLSEIGRSSTKRSYKSLEASPGLGASFEVVVATLQVPVTLAEGGKADRDFLKVTYTYSPSFEVDNGVDVVYTGQVRYSSSISLPLVSGLDVAQFASLFETKPIELLRQVDVAGDVLVYPYDAWIQGVPLLRGALD
jgi:hypothetical protein